MLGHWPDVKQTVEALVYIVKNVDPDGVELRFTSKPAVSHKSKDTTHLLEKISSNSPRVDSQCMMESALSILVDSVVPSPSSLNRSTGSLRSLGRNLFSKSGSGTKTGISMYILTNAIWTGSGHSNAARANGGKAALDLCGVDKVIQTLVDRLRSSKHNRSYVTIQFIRFGHDPVGKQRLRYLDNDIEEAIEWDIVDRRYFKRAVRPMLIGAISSQEDYQSDDSEDEGAESAGAG